MTVTVSRSYAVPVEAAWSLLVSTGTWSRWGPSVRGVEPSAAVLTEGLRGRVRTPLGIWLPFRITQLEPQHSWTWSVLGIPATSHRVDAEPGGSRVTFGVPRLAFPYLVVCRLALGRIAAELERDVT